MHDFRTVQTTTIVGGGRQFSNSKHHIEEENYDDSPLIPEPVIIILPRVRLKQTAGGIQLAQQGTDGKCDVRAGDGILWRRPLIPRTVISADTVAVGRQLGALPTVVLPLTEVHVRAG